MQLTLFNPDSRRSMRMLRHAGLACAIAVGAGLLAAQVANQPKTKTHKKPAAGHRLHPQKSPKTATAVPAPPAAPPRPTWPADQPAQPATITWDSHGLEVKAANSSLQQILSEIQMDTGAKVEGLQNDVRVFGNYGPGPARDVLYQLLHGTGCNVLMLGNEGQGKPLTVILTARTAAGPPNQAQTPPQVQDDDNADNQQGTPMSPVTMPGNQPQFMSPQQRWQEMQQERERQQQQQLEQQQGPPPQ